MESGLMLIKAEKALDEVKERSIEFLEIQALCAVGYAILALAMATENVALEINRSATHSNQSVADAIRALDNTLRSKKLS